MAKIVFIFDMEEGHIIPTFGLAQSLKQRGHEITYLSFLDNEQLVKEQGFAFHPLLIDLFPLGFRQKLKQSTVSPELEQELDPDRLRRIHVEQLINGAYDSFLRDNKADLYIVSVFLTFGMLILYYKYRIIPVVVNPVLRQPGSTVAGDCLQFISGMSTEEKQLVIGFFDRTGIGFNSLQELIQPLDSFNELVLCPLEFEITPAPGAAIRYTEASLRPATSFFDVYKAYGIGEGKKIVYASMGTQAMRHGAVCDLFYKKILGAMNYPELQNLHLILCIGQEYDKTNLGSTGENVTILNWGPQINILQVTSVAIIHGGLGGIKECIYHGVPMIVFPMGYDQPYNAMRVAYHGLGFVDDIETISENDLAAYLVMALHDHHLINAVQKMKNIFREKEKKQAGASIIEAMLTATSNSLETGKAVVRS